MIKKTDQTKKGVELMIPGIVIGVIVLIIVIWLISSYNGFVTLRNKTEEAFSAIDVSLKKRYDLIPNYVETVKGYAKHESETLEKVVAARNQAMTATNIDDKIKQENVLSGALKSLFAVSDSYPELKANTNFMNLQENLKEIENNISYARQIYNKAVLKYKNKLEMFPSNIIADIFNFKPELFFTIDSDDRENPNINFNEK